MKDAHVFSHYKEAVIGAVVDLAAEHPEVVFLDADLSSCIGSTTFQNTCISVAPSIFAASMRASGIVLKN